jgi:hypothetical protein
VLLVTHGIEQLVGGREGGAMHLIINNGYIAGRVLIWVVVAIALVLILTSFSIGRAVSRAKPGVTPEQMAQHWGRCRVCGGLAVKICTCRSGPNPA